MEGADVWKGLSMLSKRAAFWMILTNMVATLLTVLVLTSPGCGQRQTLSMPPELRADIGSKPGVVKSNASPPSQAKKQAAAVKNEAAKPTATGVAKPKSELQPGQQSELTVEQQREQQLVKPSGDAAASMRRTARIILLPLAWVAGVSFVLGGVASFFLPVIPRKAVAAAGGGLAAALLLLYAIDRYGPLFAEIAIWATVIIGVLSAYPWVLWVIKRSRIKAREAEAKSLVAKGHVDAGVAMLAAEVPAINKQRKALLNTLEAMKASWQSANPPLPDIAKKVFISGVVEEAKRSLIDPGSTPAPSPPAA